MDNIEDYTQWTVMGDPMPGSNDYTKAPLRRPGQPPVEEPPPPAKKEETEDEYVNRRCEEYMHKSLSCRRGLGGKFYTLRGGGDGGVAYQVIG